MSDNVREIILDTLLEHNAKSVPSHLLIRNVMDKYDYLSIQDKSFFKRLTEGTITRQITLDYVINSFSKVPANKCKPFIRCLLRMSVYQILYMDKVPDSAVCNEAVKLCKKRHFDNLSGFVNGVLRNIARNKDKCPDVNQIKNEDERLSVIYSMPLWIVRLLMKEHKDSYEEILSSMNGINPTCVRLTHKGQEVKEDLLQKWRSLSVDYTPSKWLPNVYEMKEIQSVRDLPGFGEGLFAVQNISSMFVGEVADIKDNMVCIDVCAAPGGKTTHIADSLCGTGKVISCDISDLKTSLIQENVDRFGYQNVEVRVQDATVFDKTLYQIADVVIADVPCSGLGVMGRKSDIRYQLSETSMSAICELQKNIIDTIWQYVKPGGVLIYSTCTIHKRENEKMADYIVANYPFVKENISDTIPKELFYDCEDQTRVQLLPNIPGLDGFFIQKLRRKDKEGID